MSVITEEIDLLYQVADDYEAVVLDALRRRAGITWECSEDNGGCGWTNVAADTTVCGSCGTDRNDRKTVNLTCDGWCESTGVVTMIDDKGYAYCTPCGQRRKSTHRCRKLTATELATLRSGKPIASY